MRRELTARVRNQTHGWLRHSGMGARRWSPPLAAVLVIGVLASPMTAAGAMPMATPKNSLKILVKGSTPSPPRIQVTGPKQTAASTSGFSKTITKTTTFKGVAPGSYTVKSSPVQNAGSTYAPSPTIGRIVVKASGAFLFTVTYAKKAGGDPEPGAVVGLSVEPGEGRLTVKWDTSNAAKSVTYEVSAADAVSGSRAGACLIGKSGCAIFGLSTTAAYIVTVTVKARFGATWSTASTPVTPLRKGQAFVNGYVVGAGANLRGAKLQGANLARMDLTGADLTNANLTGADLSGAKMASTIISGTVFTAATLRRVQSGLVTGTATMPQDWLLIGGYLVGPGADLTGAYLDGADFTGAKMTDVLLKSAHLANSDLHGVAGATLRGLTLDSTDLAGANLSGLNLSGASLKSVDLSAANLTGANLTNAVLINTVSLTSANLTGANLTDADLSGANLVKTTLANANLTGATLKSVRSGDLVGAPSALPTDWTIRLGYLVGPWAYLASATLIGADLSGLNLTGANLGAASLISANLSGATLVGATMSGTDLSGATLTGVNATSLSGSTPRNIPSGWEYNSRTRSLVPTP